MKNALKQEIWLSDETVADLLSLRRIELSKVPIPQWEPFAYGFEELGLENRYREDRDGVGGWVCTLYERQPDPYSLTDNLRSM